MSAVNVEALETEDSAPLILTEPRTHVSRWRLALLLGMAAFAVVFGAVSFPRGARTMKGFGFPGLKANITHVAQLNVFGCTGRWPEVWYAESWAQYCNYGNHKAWAMTPACHFAWAHAEYSTQNSASTAALNGCQSGGLTCYIFDVDGSRCPTLPAPSTTPPLIPSAPPSEVVWGPPFVGAFEVSQGPRDCRPTHCIGSVSEDAVDFPTPKGTPIIAARPGVVGNVVDGHGDGGVCDFDGGLPHWDTADYEANFVSVIHADGTIDTYGHLLAGTIRVQVGDHVSRGTHLASSGNSGCSDFPHLHVATLRPTYDATVPIKFDFPCGHSPDRESRRGDFFCNTPDCTCTSESSAYCTPWPNPEAATHWENYCDAMRVPGARGVWVMTHGCVRFAWAYGTNPTPAIQYCEAVSHQGQHGGVDCTVWSRDGQRCETCATIGTSGVGAGHPCVFPFTYAQQTFYECTEVGHHSPWCATETDSGGNSVRGRWGVCSCH